MDHYPDCRGDFCPGRRGTRVFAETVELLLPADVAITATDISQPMLDLAQGKLGRERIRWQYADALDLPFPDGEFDFVACQFGVMFFPDTQRGFREALRVLRPGGHFLFIVWDSFEANSNDPTRIAGRVVGAILGRDPISLFSPPYHDRSIIRSDLEAAGFADSRLETVTELSRAGSAREAATIVCHGSGLRAAIEAHDPARLDEITDRGYRNIRVAVLDRRGRGEDAGRAGYSRAARSLSCRKLEQLRETALP